MPERVAAATVWQIEISAGDPAAFHGRPMPSEIEPSVWWFDVTTSALVLGSSQRIEQIDTAACARAGIAVVRRRSGGGAVLLEPGDALWVDVLIPRADRRWTDDIGRSAWWLGEVWREALGSVGLTGTTVHQAPMIRTRWSEQVCFAGVGGGEVMRDGAKVVGISQRRTRAGARFQCGLYRHWRPNRLAPLFGDPAPTVADLVDLAVEVDVDPRLVRSAFEAALRAG